MADVLSVPVVDVPTTTSGAGWLGGVARRVRDLSRSMVRSLLVAQITSDRYDRVKHQHHAQAMLSGGHIH